MFTATVFTVDRYSLHRRPLLSSPLTVTVFTVNRYFTVDRHPQGTERGGVGSPRLADRGPFGFLRSTNIGHFSPCPTPSPAGLHRTGDSAIIPPIPTPDPSTLFCLPATRACPQVIACLHPKQQQAELSQELWESRGGRPGLPIPDSPYGLCGRKATLNLLLSAIRRCGEVEVAVLASRP